MTTIAVDANGLVCADTQLTSDNYALRVCKLFRMANGGVISGSGVWFSAYAWIQWHLAGEMGERPTLARGTEIVMVNPDGSILVAEGDGPAFPLLDKTIALGCGRDIARAALARGLTALEAVAEAVQLDNYSSEPLQSMQTLTPTELPGVDTYTKRKRK